LKAEARIRKEEGAPPWPNFPFPISDFTLLNKLENNASECGSTLHEKRLLIQGQLSHPLMAES
jgi:hypothetical protein